MESAEAAAAAGGKMARSEGVPAITFVYLAVIIASWAANWPLMRLALDHMQPLVFSALRLAGSIALMGPALALSGRPLLPLRHERLGLFWVGQWQITLWVIFGITGLAIVPPGRAIVLAYTMPLWAFPLGVWLVRERLSRMKIFGAAVGISGLLLFMNPGLVDWRDPREVAGNLCLVAAAISWAVGSCLYRRRVWMSGFWSQTFWQLATALPPVLALALALERDWSVDWTAGVVAILVYNWVITTALGYFLWNRVLAVLSPAIAGQVMTLTPIAGFFLSIAVFGGAVTAEILVSIGLIALGLALTLRRERPALLPE
ncbi:MAG TPA: DMT family transporter [Stellaceae bacterium]|nr:DMT family transporter [Stellaceae bacterium]